jgi:hypothetical protein
LNDAPSVREHAQHNERLPWHQCELVGLGTAEAPRRHGQAPLIFHDHNCSIFVRVLGAFLPQHQLVPLLLGIGLCATAHGGLFYMRSFLKNAINFSFILVLICH